MRIDGKRVSAYTNHELNHMRIWQRSLTCNELTKEQLREIDKVLKFRSKK